MGEVRTQTESEDCTYHRRTNGNLDTFSIPLSRESRDAVIQGRWEDATNINGINGCFRRQKAGRMVCCVLGCRRPLIDRMHCVRASYGPKLLAACRSRPLSTETGRIKRLVRDDRGAGSNPATPINTLAHAGNLIPKVSPNFSCCGARRED